MHRGANPIKKRWVTLVLAVLLATASTISAAVVLAGEEDGKSLVVDKLSSRVAAILGLNETVVGAAIEQARKELWEEAFQAKLTAYRAKLDALVDEGELTPEQADAKVDSFQSKLKKPFAWTKKATIDSEALEAKLTAYGEKLNAMVEKGQLTQEQADEKLRWIRKKTA